MSMLEHEWRVRGDGIVCQRCGRKAQQKRCPVCRIMLEESTIAHGSFGRPMCKGRPRFTGAACHEQEEETR